MTLRFAITRSRREWLPTLALLMLLQSVIPAFAGIVANPVSGHFDVLCTMNGPQRISVKLDESGQPPSACYECPTCILQLGVDDEAVLESSGTVSYRRLLPILASRTPSPVVDSLARIPYLSRAPPA